MLKKIFHIFFGRKKQNKDNLAPLRLLAEERRWRELEQKSREALVNTSDKGDALSLLAYSLQQQSFFDEAFTFAAQAARLSPTCWLSHFIAGVALSELGRNEEACQYLRQTVAISPKDSQSVRKLIGSIAALEGIESAAAEYKKHCHQTGSQPNILVAPVSTVRNWAERVNLTLLEAGEVETIPFKAPCISNITSSDEITIALSNKPYVAEITNAQIFSQSSLILTNDGTVLSDTGGDAQFGRYVSFAYEAVVLAQQPSTVLLNFSEFKTREIASGIFLGGLASNAFGHWLPEFLPKLQFLQQHPNFVDFPLIVDADMPQSHFDHLRRLTNQPLILLQAHESLLCQRLLIAPSPAFFPVELFPNNIPVQDIPGLSPRALKFIRGNEPPLCRPSPFRRLFLARKNMKWRHLLNEDDIALDLSSLGFETIMIEDLTAQDQIVLFQEAAWIVAPNGSALLNIIFADTQVKLVVLIQPNLFNWGSFQGPMDALGYHSVCVCGEYAVASNQKHSDYYVSKQQIRQALSNLGMKEAIV